MGLELLEWEHLQWDWELVWVDWTLDCIQHPSLWMAVVQSRAWRVLEWCPRNQKKVLVGEALQVLVVSPSEEQALVESGLPI